MGKKKSATQKAAAAAAAAAAAGAMHAAGAQPEDAAGAAAPDAAGAAAAAEQQGARATVRRSTMPGAAAGASGAAAPAAGEEANAAAAAAAAAEAEEAALLAPVLFLLIEAPNGKSVKVETTPTDCVLDVRQFLLDCPETAEYTCYRLESAATGEVLNDYLELQDYPALIEQKQGQMSTLKIVPELYDDRASRLHVRRLRELLVKPPAHIQPSAVQAGYEDETENVDQVAAVVVKKGKKGASSGNKDASSVSSSSPDDVLTPLDAESFSLRQFHVAKKEQQPSATLVDAVRNVGFSGWNPPPGNRALQGDLLYLEITTAEGLQAHVTANQEGFYLNQSTNAVFNPEKADTPYMSLTLVQLLRRISPIFQAKYTKVSHLSTSSARTNSFFLHSKLLVFAFFSFFSF
jgi:protein TIF31